MCFFFLLSYVNSEKFINQIFGNQITFLKNEFREGSRPGRSFQNVVCKNAVLMPVFLKTSYEFDLVPFYQENVFMIFLNFHGFYDFSENS